MEKLALIPHLFRTEYRKIVSVLCRRFGLSRIEEAEDIASETFLTAVQTWSIEGVPANPTAWLYTVAKNKAWNQLQRHKLFERKISPSLMTQQTGNNEIDIDLSTEYIADSQLQMMFALCHPSIPQETQIGLCLRILCGFGIDEIADAFLTNKENINKRLLRGRDKLREANIEITFPDLSDIEQRLDPVLGAIYLLFSEGYYSFNKDKTLRKDLSLEAIRLCTMLVENKVTNRPRVNALMSLMCFHASRFDARFSDSGEMILYGDQDSALWNKDWIGKGGYFLMKAREGDSVSTYHIEAGIAYWSTLQEDTAEKWNQVLRLYDQLLVVKYSPVAALNRIYAQSKVAGNAVAIAALQEFQLTDNHFYYALLGELHVNDDRNKAVDFFKQALQLAKSSSEKLHIQKRLDSLRGRS